MHTARELSHLVDVKFYDANSPKTQHRRSLRDPTLVPDAYMLQRQLGDIRNNYPLKQEVADASLNILPTSKGSYADSRQPSKPENLGEAAPRWPHTTTAINPTYMHSDGPMLTSPQYRRPRRI